MGGSWEHVEGCRETPLSWSSRRPGGPACSLSAQEGKAEEFELHPGVGCGRGLGRHRRLSRGSARPRLRSKLPCTKPAGPSFHRPDHPTHRLLPKCQGPPAVASDACPVPTLPRGRNVARGWASRSVRQGEMSEHRLRRYPPVGPGGGARPRACSSPHPASPTPGLGPEPPLRLPSPLPCGLGHQPPSCS